MTCPVPVGRTYCSDGDNLSRWPAGEDECVSIATETLFRDTV